MASSPLTASSRRPGSSFFLRGGGVAVGGMVGGDRGLAEVPGVVATVDGGLADREQRLAHRAGLQRTDRVANRFQVLGHAELAGFAQSDHQHPRRGDAGQVVQQQAATGAAAEVAALEQGAQAAAAGFVDGLARGRERLVGIGANHDAVEGGRGGGFAVQGELQGH